MMEYFSQLTEANFLRIPCLWLLLGLIPFCLYGMFFRKRQALSTLIRATALALLIIALANPVRVDSSSTQQLAAVLDISASIPDKARRALLEPLMSFIKSDSPSKSKTGSGTESKAGSKAGSKTLALYPFSRLTAKQPILVSSKTTLDQLLDSTKNQQNSLDRGETDISQAIRTALSHSKSSSLLLLSDGHQTIGDSSQAALEAMRSSVKIFPLIPDENVFRNNSLSISAIQAPITTPAGARTEVAVSVKNDFTDAKNSPALLSLHLDDKMLLDQQILVPSGQEKLFTVKTAQLNGGLHRLRATLTPLKGPEKGQMSELHRWIAVREESKILMISGAKDDQRVLKSMLRVKGYGLVDIIADGKVTIPVSFERYSTIVLNNVAKRQLPRDFLSYLKAFVKKDGGLLLLGGDRSYGLGGYIKTPLEEISPLKFVPPQTEKRRLISAVVLVLDKSGSMVHQGKITAAKRASLLSIKSLKDDDYISVIGFDHAPFVIIDIQTVKEAKVIAESRLRNLTAVGSTNLLPALAAARVKLRGVPASRKHIIVLSDGKFPLASNQYVEEINRLRKEGVSVSTVALGLEADVPFMKILSKYGKGAFYHTLDPSRLPQIFVDDIKVSTGEKTLHERKDYPVAVGPGGLVSTKVNRYRPLRGFVETLPKKGSTLELITKRGDKSFPILASWNYGVGKVVAFTSDTNGRWSSLWLNWDQFSVFWGHIIETLSGGANSKKSKFDFDLRYRVERKNVILDLAIFDDRLETEPSPKITAAIVQPGGQPITTAFRPIAKGRFESVINNARPGDYEIEIRYGDLSLPKLAITLAGNLFGEVLGKGLNRNILEEIATKSGGMINPKPEQVPLKIRVSESSKHLFPPLLIMAFFLLLIEAFVRELGLGRLFVWRRKGVVGGERSKRPVGSY